MSTTRELEFVNINLPTLVGCVKTFLNCILVICRVHVVMNEVK